jgi:UDP-N-acetylmuramoyl-tripeptide--D-alanyl-D-alanine ligase
MKRVTLREITNICAGHFFGNDELLETPIKGITIDSRTAQEGFLFIPIKGERFDGHDFIESVFEKKAICCLSEQKLVSDKYSYILVDSCFQAFKDIAEYYRTLFDVKVVAITGSVGKTTTKEMIASVLSQKYNVLKSQGNFNNEFGLPLTIFNLNEKHEIAVLEMGMNNFGEISRLSKIARPDICVITNIGVAHIENLKSREGIFQAKAEIFDYMKKDAKTVLNGDDDMLITLKESTLEPIFYGLSEVNDTYAENVVNLGLDGTDLDISLGNSKFAVHISSPGEHMIYNALAAATVGSILGLCNDEIKRGIESYVSIDNRMNIKKINGITLINDVYNSSPASVKAAIEVLCYSTNRKVCILGDMFELGLNSATYHYEIGQYAAQKKVDTIICTGELAKYISDGACENKISSEVVYFSSQDEMIDCLGGIIKEGDSVLVKASRGMHFEKTIEWLEVHNNLTM